MPNLRRTLFVCTGNVFRSAISERCFIRNVLNTGSHFQVRSRGTRPYFKVPHPLLDYILEKDYSITLKKHRAQKLSLADIVWASAIVCFTPEHQQAVIRICPSARGRTFLIYDITSLDQTLFEDVDYHNVSETNKYMLEELEALKLAVDEMTKPASLSIVMAVYNEEKNIKNILTKLVAQSFSRDVREIVVVSSGSTDKTNEIIQTIQSPLVTLVKEEIRNGKVYALKKAIPFVRGGNVLLIDGDVDVEDGFIKECFSCIRSQQTPCTGKIVPVQGKSKFFYRLSILGCEAWNALRNRSDKAGTFLYPSGYTILLPKNDFVYGIECMGKTTINDDGLLSLVLFRKGVLFHYCDDLQVRVVFPQSILDFFRQKIRTRMGRRQVASRFFKKVEKQWRRELLNAVDARNFILVIVFLALDCFAKCVASMKIRFSHSPHLWKPAVTTKTVEVAPVMVRIEKTNS